MPTSKAGQSKGRQPRRSERGGATIRLLRTLVLLTALIGADAFVTQRALTGTWQMEMTPDVEKHVIAVMEARSQARGGDGPEGSLEQSLRTALRKNFGKAGSALLRGAANQVQLKIEDGSFEVVGAKAQLVTSTLASLATPGDEQPTPCLSGKILAAFPLARLTCIREGEDTVHYAILRSWPSETLTAFPLALTEQRLDELATQVEARAAGAPAPAKTDPEARAALEQIFTLHFRRMQPNP